jgi:hypothetical protein
VSLRRLKDSNTAVAHQLDICETVALQACFHGGNTAAWAEIFTNEDVVIAGTELYSPTSASHASHAIAQAALAAREALENGATPPEAERVALRVPYAGSLRRNRGFVVFIRNAESSGQHARMQVDTLREVFEVAKPRIAAIRTAGEQAVTAFGQAVLDQTYALVLSYQNALNTLWIIDGREGGPDGTRAREIAVVNYLREDVFAIRKHAWGERPTPPAWLPAEYAVGVT